jgi:hypothetical protein
MNAIPDKKDREDVFEIFIEGYLETQTITQCVKHWVIGNIPLSLRELYNLPRDTPGIDGVYETNDGDQYAYKVKYSRPTGLTMPSLRHSLG